MPTEQRGGLDEESNALRSGDQAAEAGEERSVLRLQSRTSNLAMQNRHFVPEHDHFDRQSESSDRFNKRIWMVRMKAR